MHDTVITKTNNDERIKRWMSDGLIVAVFSIVAYLIAFAYEAVFAEVYGIPYAFITLNLTNVFIVAAYLLGILLFLYGTISFIYMFMASSEGYHPIYRCFARTSPAFLFFVVFVLIFGTHWKEWIWGLIPLAWFAFFEFAFPLITQRDKNSYTEKLKPQEIVEANVDTLLHYTERHVGRLCIGIILCLMALTIFSYSSGRAQALRQNEFLVLSTSPEAVVLRIYGDTLICALFNRETKHIQRSFFITRIPENSKLILKLEKVGPLQPIEN